jgi:hypothetical protein
VSWYHLTIFFVFQFFITFSNFFVWFFYCPSFSPLFLSQLAQEKLGCSCKDFSLLNVQPYKNPTHYYCEINWQCYQTDDLRDGTHKSFPHEINVPSPFIILSQKVQWYLSGATLPLQPEAQTKTFHLKLDENNTKPDSARFWWWTTFTKLVVNP